MLFIRSILPYQNENTNVLINQTPFNQSTLTHFNYTLYSNGTLSNTTHCYLTFNSFHPHLFSNGSFINATSCYSPINEIRAHASLGLAFALLYALTIIFTLVNIRKHGRRYLPVDGRYSTFSRVVTYYWLLAVAVLAAISCFMGVDVDRDYLQSDPLVLQSIFYMSTWQKRQIHDRDPYAFTFSPPSSRTYQENTLPLLFYALALTTLLLSLLHPWAQIPLQRSPEQQALIAEPVATDPRFKGAGRSEGYEMGDLGDEDGGAPEYA
ncbi:hypothetical protein MW887_001619 [Aspergillus wentii]|nr:hypothetical protein MW887_001619 [Aspergillus wentii]